MRRPAIRYARSGDVAIAYQVVGGGELDLVVIPIWVSHLEYAWEEPSLARFYERLASFSRLVLLDKRGTGLSDRPGDSTLPTLEERMDDVRAVLDAIGSERAALFGAHDGGTMAALFAATYPERTVSLATFGMFARRLRATDYEYGWSSERRQSWLDEIERTWGGPVGLAEVAPSVAGDPRFERWWATYLRHGASPGAAVALARMNSEIDIRDVLPAIHVPTLILHRRDDRRVSIEEARFIADRIATSRLVELDGADHLPWVGDQTEMLAELEEFLTGARSDPEPHRVLATVLFTDIVGSTSHLAALGDARWREILARHDAIVERELERWQGRAEATTGDGFVATFDGPARGIRCTLAILEAVRELGIEVRAGLHTGECEIVDGRLTGLAVHIGARVGALAGPGEVVVSSTVRDLVVGSGIAFDDRGEHELKGVPGTWRLYAVADG